MKAKQPNLQQRDNSRRKRRIEGETPMNMFATQGGVVELWVTKTDTYTSTKTGEIYASVQSIAPIPEGARGNAKGFEISEYNIEPTLLDAIVFEGQPVLCKFASVVRPQQAGHAGAGQRPDQQVCRGLSGQALLRRLRTRRQGRAAGHRPRQATVRRRLRQRPAALWFLGQRRGVPGAAQRRRHHPRHEPGPRRPSHPRRQGVLLRQAVQRRAVRPGHRYRADRLRRSRAPGRGA